MSRVSDKPHFVYVFWSESGSCFYIGLSENPSYRLEQHNSGKYRGWTHRYIPWKIVFTEQHPNYRSARRRELELKRQKGGKGFFAKPGLDPKQFGR